LVTEDGQVAVKIFGPVTGNEPQALLFIFNSEFGLHYGKKVT
jgi:hypothetical protein